MSVLGFDYGHVRLGLAIADGPLAQPLTVLNAADHQKLLSEISEIIQKNGVTRLVIGVSEGKMGLESQKFASLLRESFAIPVEEVDETLTTVEAQKKLVEGHKNRKSRHRLLDSTAAAIILQSWLDLAS